MGKFKLFTGGQKKIAKLFDKNEMTKLQKQIDKSQSTKMIESHILYYKGLRDFNTMSDNKQYNYLVLIDNTEVKDSVIKKIEEWLSILGESLMAIATKELKAIIDETQNYNKSLNGEMGAIEQLKTLLNVITEIKNKSMDMEFRIVEVQEQFRVLNMYNYEIEESM